MLTLIEGGFFSGGKEKIKNLISERTKLNQKSLLIVPEQQTVKSEREMTDLLPPSAPLYFEVTNFTRLANTVFRTLGGLAKTKADSVKSSLIMWRTLKELSPVLKSINTEREITSGSVSRMLDTMGQLRSLALDASSLRDAADELKNKNSHGSRLYSKLCDISVIMALYKKLLTEKFSDGDDELLLAKDKIASAPKEYLCDTDIYIDGFTSFTTPQYEIIRELLLRCNVTIHFIIPKEYPDAFEYSEIKNTHQKIIKIANDIGTDVKLERITGIHTDNDPLICDTAMLLWRSHGKIDKEFASRESIKIYEAKDPYEECDFIASDIKKRVMDGAKYSEFGIIARNLSPYENILKISFDKTGVPLFISSKTDIGTYEAVKLMFNALSVIANGFERRDVISYSKCSLSGVSSAHADEFELYAEKWQINGKRFTDGVIWNMNPSGYTERRTEKDEEKLLFIDEARNEIISPLLAFSEDVSEATTVKNYTEALVNFLVRLKIEENLKRKAKEATFLLGNDAAEDLLKLWQIICDTFDSLCEILGDLKTDTKTYLNLLKIAFSKTNIGKIPSFREQVSAQDAEAARMSEKRYIYILGANAGEFPSSIDDDSYFTENDKKELSEAGLSIESDFDIKSARELYLFTRALSYARRALTITYHSADASLKPSAPSEVISKIKDLSNEKIIPQKIECLPLEEKTFSPEYLLEHIQNVKENLSTFRESIKETSFKSRLDVSDKSIKNSKLKLSKDIISLLYGKSIKMTQSKIEKYAKCPMSYFCTYNLSLKQEEKVEFDARNIGTFIHSVLENFFIKLKEKGKKISETTDCERVALIENVAKDYIKRCFQGIPETSARIKNTINKICRAAKPIVDSLCDEFEDCKYDPIFFELEIGNSKNSLVNAPKFHTDDNKEVILTGKADRVDVYKKDNRAYIRVIDYKSGNKIFSPTDIENGVNLQMFLYLKSIVNSNTKDFKEKIGTDKDTKLIPAGVIYVKTDISEAKISHNDKELALDAVKKNQARIGMILNDDESISAMNQNFIPIKLKKDGTPDSHSKDKLYDNDGWEAISNTVDRAVTDICNNITSGDIPAAAFVKKGEKSPCTYCEFKAICRSAKL